MDRCFTADAIMTMQRGLVGRRLMGLIAGVVIIGVFLRPSWGQWARRSSLRPPSLSGGKPPSLVDVNDELGSYLVGARKNIKDGKYDRAIEVLQALIEKRNSGFVADSGGKQYVALWHKANETLASMGSEGLGLYRRLYDPQAERIFKQAVDTQDTTALRKLTQQFLLTTYGYRALCRLGDVYFDRGQFSRSAMYWRRALRLKNSAEQSAMLTAKIGAALHLAGDSTGADIALGELKKKYKDSVGLLGGREQNLARFVETIRKIPVPKLAARQLKAGKEWGGLGSFPDGIAVMAESDVVLTPSWRAPGDVPIGPVNIRGKMVAMQARVSGYSGGYTMTPKPRKGHVHVTLTGRSGYSSTVRSGDFFMPAAVQPVVSGNMVLCRFDEGVSAYDLTAGPSKDGKPIWSTRFSQVNRRGHSATPTYSPTVLDNGRYAMTVAGDRLYLLAKFVPKSRSRSSRTSTTTKYSNTSVLQSLSISRSGRLMWQSDDKSVNSDEGVLGGKFVSTPTVHNGRVYSLMAFQEMYHLVCMTADTGKLIWRVAISQIPAVSSNYRTQNQHLLEAASPVAIAEGMAFVTTNAGVVAAFEAESGAAVWAYQYDSYVNKAISRYGSVVQLPGQPSVNPVIVTQGKVITLPVDSKNLLMLSVVDGKPVGSQINRRDYRDLSAIDSQRVLLSGPGLIVLSAATGRELHKIPDMGVVGRPAISNDSILASGQGQLIRLDLEDYSRSTRVFTNSDCLLGNLLCVEGKLIAANSAGVCVYLGYEESVARLSKRIETSTGFDKIKLTFDRGQLAFNSGKFAAALADFKITAAAAASGRHTAIDAQVKHWSYRTCVAMGNAADTADKMQAYFEQARKIAETIGGDSGDQYRLRCMMRLARVMELRAVEYQAASAAKSSAGDKAAAASMEAKRHEALAEAVVYARKIAEMYPDKRVPDIRVGAKADTSVRDTEDTPVMPAGLWAQKRFIPRIIRDHGRKCYSAFDQKAGDMLQQAIADNNSNAMLEVAKRWPNSLWAPQAMYEAGASLYAKTRRENPEDYAALSNAAAMMAESADTDDPMLTASSMAGRATIYHGMGMTNYARSICRDMRKLCRAKGISLSDTIELDGGQQRIIDILKKCEDHKPLALGPRGTPESIKTPLKAVFGFKGEEIIVVRDQEYRPVRQGANVLLLEGGKAVWFNTAAKSAQDAIVWKSGAPIAPMDQIRNYLAAPGYGIIAGFSRDGKTLVVADRGSASGVGFDVKTGKALWRGTFARWETKTVSYMACGDGVLVLADTAGKVVCVDMDNGKLRWVGSRLSGSNKAVTGPPRVAAGVVMVKNNSHRTLTCFDARRGKAIGRWTGASVEGRITDGGLVFVRVDGTVSLCDPAKMDRPLWTRKYPDSRKPMLLDVRDDRLFISEDIYSPWIDIVSIRSGKSKARVKIESFTGAKQTSIVGAVARGGDLYVTFGTTVSGMRNSQYGRQTLVRGLGLQKIDLEEARVTWRDELGAASQYFYSLPLTVAGDTVAMVCKSNQQLLPRTVHLFDAGKGLLQQKIEVYKGQSGILKQGDRVRLGAMQQPMVINGRLLVETFDGVGLYEPE